MCTVHLHNNNNITLILDWIRFYASNYSKYVSFWNSFAFWFVSNISSIFIWLHQLNWYIVIVAFLCWRFVYLFLFLLKCLQILIKSFMVERDLFNFINHSTQIDLKISIFVDWLIEFFFFWCVIYFIDIYDTLTYEHTHTLPHSFRGVLLRIFYFNSYNE